MLLVGEILCGLPWGVFQTITTAYAAEVTPVALRPYLTTYVNLCWVMGQFVGACHTIHLVCFSLTILARFWCPPWYAERHITVGLPVGSPIPSPNHI